MRLGGTSKDDPDQSLTYLVLLVLALGETSQVHNLLVAVLELGLAHLLLALQLPFQLFVEKR